MLGTYKNKNEKQLFKSISEFEKIYPLYENNILRLNLIRNQLNSNENKLTGKFKS